MWKYIVFKQSHPKLIQINLNELKKKIVTMDIYRLFRIWD